MTRRAVLDDMDPAERLPVIFPYAKELEAGETLTGAVIGVTLAEGADATPAAMLDGAALVQPDKVVQRVYGRIDGNTYEVRCEATTSLGNVRVLTAVQRVQRA